MEKIVIYNSDSFANVIKDVNSHITSIKDVLNDKFILESYQGTSADEIQSNIQGLIDNLSTSMNKLDSISEKLNECKAKYDELINEHKTAVGGDTNV